MKTLPVRFNGITAGLTLAIALSTTPAAAVEINFYYPVSVGGPITKIMDKLAADFEKTHPDIQVKPIYSGSYQDTSVKILTAIKGGGGPDLAVALSTDLYTFIDEDAIVAYDDLITQPDGTAKQWFDSFYPAFMSNSQTGGKTWGIPFQRSTVVMYWNKDLFSKAGLDPDTPPKNWDELVTFGQKLTQRDDAGNTTRWGVQIPSSGFPYWLFQTFSTQNDSALMNDSGTRTFFNAEPVVKALQFWVDLSTKYKIHPPGVVEWGTTPKDFFERKAAIIYTTTGNLTNIRKHAGFNFGVAMLPAGERRGSPTGGGNFYIFKHTSAQKQQAALKFVRWISDPERSAQWSIDTGYVAVSPAAWQTARMKNYLTDFSAPTVARNQLAYTMPELSTHDNQRVTKALDNNLQAALTGSKTPQQALDDAQHDAERILKAYQ